MRRNMITAHRGRLALILVAIVSIFAIGQFVQPTEAATPDGLLGSSRIRLPRLQIGQKVRNVLRPANIRINQYELASSGLGHGLIASDTVLQAESLSSDVILSSPARLLTSEEKISDFATLDRGTLLVTELQKEIATEQSIFLGLELPNFVDLEPSLFAKSIETERTSSLVKSVGGPQKLSASSPAAIRSVAVMTLLGCLFAASLGFIFWNRKGVDRSLRARKAKQITIYDPTRRVLVPAFSRRDK